MLNENEDIVIDFEGFYYNNLIFKELTVCGKNFQDTLLFKPPKDLIDCSMAQRRSINSLTRRIHGIDWNSGFYPYSFVNEYFVSLRIRFPKVTVFVKGKNKAQLISQVPGKRSRPGRLWLFTNKRTTKRFRSFVPQPQSN